MKLSDMIVIDPPEKTRTYEFPEGEKVAIANVTHLKVSDSGTHRLRTGDGLLHIVPVGWLHILIDAGDWTV